MKDRFVALYLDKQHEVSCYHLRIVWLNLLRKILSFSVLFPQSIIWEVASDMTDIVVSGSLVLIEISSPHDLNVAPVLALISPVLGLDETTPHPSFLTVVKEARKTSSNERSYLFFCILIPPMV